MLELSTSGSVGGAVGNHCFYPAGDAAIAALYRGANWLCEGVSSSEARCASRGAPELFRWAARYFEASQILEKRIDVYEAK